MSQIALFIIFSIGFTVHGQDFAPERLCNLTPIGYLGTCKLLAECESVKNELLKKQRLPHICYFQGTQPVVCCPNERKTGVISRQKCKEYSRYALEENGQKSCEHKIEKRLVGGSKAGKKEFPHMVTLGFQLPHGINWKCGGSIISEKYILTGAQCLKQNQTEVTYVLIGVTNLNDTNHRQNIRIIERILYPEYKNEYLYHDIALLKLETPIEFNVYARPACLYTSKRVNDDKGVATGWGTSSGPINQKLQKVTLNFVDLEFCNMTYKKFSSLFPNGIIDEFQLCSIGTEGRDIAIGDSGGPLQIKHTSSDIDCMYDIVGVTSYRRDREGYPSVFTRVSYYLDWIERTVWPETFNF